MERLILKYQDAIQSLETLKGVVKEPYSIYMRDATIQRFEYTFETCWKLLKEYLQEKEGIQESSPKAVFRAAFKAGFLSEEETQKFLEMTDRRNDSSHAYKEKLAQAIYEDVKSYVIFIERLLGQFKNKV